MHEKKVIFASRFKKEHDEFGWVAKQRIYRIEIVGITDNVDELVRLTKEKKPHFIFSGFQLEGGNICDAVRKIKKFDKKVKVIVATKVYDTYNQNSARESGVDVMFHKDYNFILKFIDYMRLYSNFLR